MQQTQSLPYRAHSLVAETDKYTVQRPRGTRVSGLSEETVKD